MKNISFDNPYLLLIAIPLLLLTLIPFCIAIRKSNRSKSAVISLILHIVMIVLVALAVARTLYTSVITRTEIYVVADVSYSANRNLDKVDDYISELCESVPKNSGVGVVCFGKNYVLLRDLMDPELSMPSVTTAELDDSDTNIALALNYTATLFGENTIRRVVLISDGKQSDSDKDLELLRAIENLYAKGIHLDTIYLDDNMDDTLPEVQISAVDYTKATYLNRETTVDVLVQSNRDTKAVVTLTKNGNQIYQRAVDLTVGNNILNLDLDTAEAGRFDYELTVDAFAFDNDTSAHNNSYPFHQTVTETRRILLVSSSQDDIARIRSLYGEDAEIDAYYNGYLVDEDGKRVQPQISMPYTLDALIKYDEYILSSVDVRSLANVTTFVESLDLAVSRFGKSLITYGNLFIQNKTDDVLKQLEDMLPVRFGNNNQDSKLYGILVDISRSMENVSRFQMMKQAACQLIDLLGSEDYVTIVSFAGDTTVELPPIQVSSGREAIKELINGLEPIQGTMLDAGLKNIAGVMNALEFGEKQVMIISDGKPYSASGTSTGTKELQIVQNMWAEGIQTSTINIYSDPGSGLLMNLASKKPNGIDRYYYYLTDEESLETLILAEVADDLTETVIEKQTSVNIQRPNDDMLHGMIGDLPDIYGYVYAKTKASATKVLTVDYKKPGDATTGAGGTTESTIFAHWNYGNGKVITFTSSVSGAWAQDWQTDICDQFFENIFEESTPFERIDYPYSIYTEFNGSELTLEIIPATFNPNATLTVEFRPPVGKSVKQELFYGSSGYTAQFSAPELGRYEFVIHYSYTNASYESTTIFQRPYSPEYDAFAAFSPSALYTAVRDRGTVTEDGVPELINDDKEIATYRIDFTIPLLIAAVVIFVVDIIIRKLKWNDIKSFFRPSKQKGGSK